MNDFETPPGDRTALDSVRGDAAMAPIAAELLWFANQAEDEGALLRAALPALGAAAGGDYTALAVAKSGRWTIAGDTGNPRPLPLDLLADVLDREVGSARDDWVAAPLAVGAAADVLVMHCGTANAPGKALSLLGRIGPVLRQALAAVRARWRERRRIRRLEAILEIAHQWNQTEEMETLLVQMAEAATRLFEADRASIFLWDRQSHTLVARPALGVEGDQLRIPDDRGIVGQVVQTGQTRRVDAAFDQDQIDRQVDAKLGYKTKTLLCVPLRGRNGELFGAFEVINKLSGNFTDEDQAGLVELATHAGLALENTQQREQLLTTNRQMTEQAAGEVQLIGKSPSIEALRSIIRRVADTELAVLILGENGTGKEVVSRSIHYLSGRKDRPFIAVNCAAIAETLAESELFGHEKGAFTDAHETRQGKFELAAGGTLFLDEIGDLSLSGQAKLLRVLEEKVLVRVGGSTPIPVDARVVAATNQNLAEMVRQKRFREDLFFRLNVVTMELPPLRERRDDILLLAEHFLTDFSRKARRKVPSFTAAARKRLEAHAWPGNVRELRNLMERLAYLSTEDRIEANELEFILSPGQRGPALPGPDMALADATAAFQTEYIKQAIERAGGNMSQAAGQLGLHRSNLYRKMRQLQMAVPD